MLTGLTAALPFELRYPTRAGAGTAADGAGGKAVAGQASSPRAASPTDVVEVRGPLPLGEITAEAGDRFSLRELFDAGPGAFDGVARYRVALRADPAAAPGAGRLLLRGADVSDRTDFTPAEFTELLFEAGPDGSRQDLLVVARAGTADGRGGLTGIADSAAVQISARVTGTRSIEAAAALRTLPGADEAAFLRVAQEASLFNGLGGPRPALTTVGNVTAEAGDRFSLRELFDAGPDAFDGVARYRVALRADPAAAPGAGGLLLRGADVSDRTDFTPAEFTELQFEAGPDGSRQDLVVVARRGTSDGRGGLTGIVDSPAVQISAAVTGTRSINAAAALRTLPGADEAAFLRVAADASLFSGLGGPRPALTTVGNVTAEAGDRFSLRELFDAGPDAFDGVARYRVALRADPAAAPGAGRLLLRGADVSDRTDFTPAEFTELLFEAGPDGSRQDLVVVARRGTSDGRGGLTGIVDSQPVQITAGVTGTRSINAAAALRTAPGADEAAFLRVAADASLFSGPGGSRPALTAVGNFGAAAGDRFSLRELYDAGPDAFDGVARYRVALRADPTPTAVDGVRVPASSGRLLLRGSDVSDRTDFTPAEFTELQFEAGPEGTRQDLVVVARRGTPDGQGGLTGIVDSRAVQISAAVTGTRSINAAAALRTPVVGGDAAFLRVAADASLFDGLGQPRPALTTVGNFTAEARDRFSLRELFDAGPDAFDGVARYRVALRGGPESERTSGRLLLSGADVSDRTDFTPAEFTKLQFEAGPDRSRQDLVVVARRGTSDGQGGLTGIVDSPAVQISATVTGTRSINAAAALRTPPGADEAAFLRVAAEASLFAGQGSRVAPALRSAAAAADPAIQPAALARATGALQSTVPPATQAYDLAPLFAGAVGASRTAGAPANPDAARLAALLRLFDEAAIGGLQTAGDQRALHGAGVVAYTRATR